MKQKRDLNSKINIVRKLYLQDSISLDEAQKILGTDDYNTKMLLHGESGRMFARTGLADAYLIKPRVFGDERGFFMESFAAKKLEALGINTNFVQDNHSMSRQKGVLRGLHFQLPPFAQAKLVRVVRGMALDVIVDIRKNSPTYGRWEGFLLSAKNALQLYVPRGFAHGFCTIEEDTEFLYKVDNYYSPEHDVGVIWNDPFFRIHWPTNTPILSDKDRKHPEFKYINNPFVYERS